MHRVLSIPMGMGGGRGFGEPSEFVTKRMCFSFIFFIGFLALLGGFLLGKITTERITQKQVDQCNVKLSNQNSVTEIVDHENRQQLDQQLRYDNLLFEELRLNYKTNVSGQALANVKDDYQILKTELSNLRLFDKITHSGESLVATVFGSMEADRWIVLSVSGDGITVGIELADILSKLHRGHNWKPQRTIIFCFFNQARDSCRDDISKYFKSRISAYLAVHGNAIQKNGCLVISGSDIVQSLVLRTVEESISKHHLDDDGVLEWCSKKPNYNRRQSWLYIPRLLLDVPHASVSFKTIGNFSTIVNPIDEKIWISKYRETLVRIVCLSIWNLAKRDILYWDPTEFTGNVETGLKMIDSPLFVEIKGNIVSKLQYLTTEVYELNKRVAGTEEQRNESNSLATRIFNDLMMDLDRALLCPNVDNRSQSDLALIPELLKNPSQNATSLFLRDLLKCYEDALAGLQQG